MTTTITRRFLPLLLLCALTPNSSQASGGDLSCPDKPNCVSSQAKGDHFIAPLTVSKSNIPEIKKRLKGILSHWPRTEIISRDSNIIEAVISSRWMGFKDDLMLVINQDGSVDVRSSSRTGYYDFGVNRKRVERLRGEITQ